MTAVLFAEVPGFYAEVERARRKELADRPILVGGDPRKHGVVQAASAEAVAAGVVPGMPMLKALERCPRARCLRTDLGRYREVDKRFRALLGRFAERAERSGFGAAYLAPVPAPAASASGSAPGEGGRGALARELHAQVRQELGLPLRVGAGPVKFVARLAAEECGASGFREVSASEVSAFLGPLSVSRLPGVGPNTEARLGEIGVRCVAELVALGRVRVEEALGRHGAAVFAAASGLGDARVRGTAHSQTLSQETTLAAPARELSALEGPVAELAERLARGLALEGLEARRVGVKLRFDGGERTSRTVSLDRTVATARELRAVAERLLENARPSERPVRGLGLVAAGLTRRERPDPQLPLFEP